MRVSRTICAEPAAPAWGRAEALTLAGGWALALALQLPLAPGPERPAATLALAAALALWWLAVAVVRSDLLHFVIPDEASAAIAALGLAVAAAAPWLSGEGAADAGAALLDAAAAGAGAFALFWATGALFRAAGRDALGHGDVKLAGALATWLSPVDGALALELAALGAVAALLCAGRGAAVRGTALRGTRLRDTAVPFGAFMAPAAWLVLVAAPALRDAGWLPW